MPFFYKIAVICLVNVPPFFHYKKLRLFLENDCYWVVHTRKALKSDKNATNGEKSVKVGGGQSSHKE